VSGCYFIYNGYIRGSNSNNSGCIPGYPTLPSIPNGEAFVRRSWCAQVQM
jgi:hypothetical protein